jgi:tetratricopeptide (TPR) repeat protein
MAVHGAAAAMRGSSSRADITEQALAMACALAQTSFFLSSTLLTRFFSPSATHLTMLSRSGAVADRAHDEPEDRGDPLQMEIVRQRELLAECPLDHPQRADVCQNLLHWLYQRFKETGSIALLDEVITLGRESLALRPAGHPDYARACSNLAITLRRRYEVTGNSDLQVVDETITLHREALALRPTGHPLRTNSCSDLAVALQTRYEVTGNSELLEETIMLHREALALCPAGHPDRPTSCNNLAAALQRRYEVTGSSDLLEELVILHREALALRPTGHPLRANSCNNLAVALRTRYEVTGNSNLLDQAITLDREALALCPAGHPARSMACTSLANALQTRYEVTGSRDFLDEAVKLQREALALHPTGHANRAISCNNLAIILQRRYEVTGSSGLLEEPIILHREALALRPAGHPLRASSCNNLATAIRRRYKVTGNSDLLDQAVTLDREALALRPAGHPERAISCNNLAAALRTRYKMTDSSDLLDEAITLDREALALEPTGYPDHAMCCYNLAHDLWQHHRRTHNVTVINEALVLAHESAASWAPSSSWRALCTLCYIHLESDSPHFSILTATQYLSQASALFPDDTTRFMRGMQRPLTLIWVANRDWTANISLLLLNVYSNLIDRLSRVTGFALDTASQLAGLKSASSFGSYACLAAILSARPSQAIEEIDHAQGVIWAQALHQRDPQLQDLPRSLASELETLLRAVSVPTSTVALLPSNPATRHLSPEDVRHQQNSRIQTILTEVRAMPGLERFMLGKTYAQLRETAREHPVVVLASAHGLVYALIVRNSVEEHPDGIRLKISSDHLARLRHTTNQAGLRTRYIVRDVEIESQRSMRPGNFEDTPLGALADLWQKIVEPVIDHLQLTVRIWPAHLTILTLISAHQRAMGRAKQRLYWCPTGDFAFLPIHAAGIYTGPEDSHVCCSDYVVSSYTPTLSALLNAQNKTPQTAPSHLNILAVAEDGRSPGSTVPPLFGVGPELTCVRTTAKASGHDCSVDLVPKHATVDGVAERIQTAHFVHLACHGTQDETSALESGFYLSNGRLKVSELMHLNLDKAWFAYLSACETAKSDTNQPDQVVHLTAAMLHAGFKSVVATMW